MGATLRKSNRWRRHGPASLIKAGAPLFLVGAVVWMMYGQASGDTVFALSRFWIFGLALPGFLLWRIATPRRLNLVEDIAAGSMVGVSVLVLVYLGCSALGLQKWAWLWIVPVLVAATTVSTLRRRCLRRVTLPLSATTA
jgi:surface polysaccharide O-acyltransferase-like enzyme